MIIKKLTIIGLSLMFTFVAFGAYAGGGSNEADNGGDNSNNIEKEAKDKG